MRVFHVDGLDYRLPDAPNSFQKEMYIHLINWKWKYITKEAGFNKYKGQWIYYDAMFPDYLADDFPMLFPKIVPKFKDHHANYPFRIHKYFFHMASSQAANINLFLPILMNQKVDVILSKVKRDFKHLATTQLDKGFQIEYWDDTPGTNNKGLLGDKRKTSGTDSDIAIAYYNHDDELCLWLIEHKLTESEFTQCGGYHSNNNKTKSNCSESFGNILLNKDLCHYHKVCKYNYWEITDMNSQFFVNHSDFPGCPFRSGLNQLWRNQLLALSVEQDNRQPYKHVYFSVVKHSANNFLNLSLSEYRKLIAFNPMFSDFTSEEIIVAAEETRDQNLMEWCKWYRELYNLKGKQND